MRIAFAICVLMLVSGAAEAATMAKLLGLSVALEDNNTTTSVVSENDYASSGLLNGNSKAAGSGNGAISSTKSGSCGQPTFSSCPSVPTCGMGSITRGGGSSSGGISVPTGQVGLSTVNINITIEINIDIDISADFNRPKASPSSCF